jgi:hypothetical protein
LCSGWFKITIYKSKKEDRHRWGSGDPRQCSFRKQRLNIRTSPTLPSFVHHILLWNSDHDALPEESVHVDTNSISIRFSATFAQATKRYGCNWIKPKLPVLCERGWHRRQQWSTNPSGFRCWRDGQNTKWTLKWTDKMIRRPGLLQADKRDWEGSLWTLLVWKGEGANLEGCSLG